MFDIYAMYPDIGKDNDDDYDDEESSDEESRDESILLCRHYEIRKDFQKCGQLPCKNCEKVHFKWNETCRFTNFLQRNTLHFLQRFAVF